jgi:cell fate (sporulation/competence/biofilm development) regulator YlbF (YheA/YmcA/DUF963 family)
MIEDKATELGRLIGQSDEYRAVKRTTDTLNADQAASALLKTMEQLRGDAEAMMKRGKRPSPEMEQQLDDLLMKIQSQPAYQSAIVAQDNFDKMMLRVNQWIADGIRRGATSGIITLG